MFHFINERIISSKKNVLRDDGLNVYNLDNFLYLIDEEEVKEIILCNF